MRLTASDLITYHRPSACALRVFLRHHNGLEESPGPYEQVLYRLGARHEAAHLASLGQHLDLSAVSEEERIQRTIEAVGQRAPVIYQAGLVVATALGGTDVTIVGRPDFLVLGDHGYTIRDSKMSRRITEDDHPEILLQVQLYGWLFDRVFGYAAAALEVHSGTGDSVVVPYDGGAAALAVLEQILRIKQGPKPYSPVGWTKCGACGFHDRCWTKAVDGKDVALVVDVDQGLARVLHEKGITTWAELLQGFDEATLADLKRPWGERMAKVGKKAVRILLMADVMERNEQKLLVPPDIPIQPNYVMFDLEGLPPQLDELEKVYLWGLQVFGEKPGKFLAATAGFGQNGDREGWEQFLSNAGDIFTEYGDLPFVHWHHYERVHIDMYVERFGDRDGIAARVKANLLDLLPITEHSIALPLPSYSLKVVEKYVGFRRQIEEGKGDWAMAMYIEAVEMEDQAKRDSIMNQILAYNQEDLEATWAVFQWLRGHIRQS